MQWIWLTSHAGTFFYYFFFFSLFGVWIWLGDGIGGAVSRVTTCKRNHMDGQNVYGYARIYSHLHNLCQNMREGQWRAHTRNIHRWLWEFNSGFLWLIWTNDGGWHFFMLFVCHFVYNVANRRSLFSIIRPRLGHFAKRFSRRCRHRVSRVHCHHVSCVTL